MADDKPKIDLVLSDLEKEIVLPEEYVVVLAGNKRITFNDPWNFRIKERNELFDLYDRAKRGEADDMEFLKRILSDADFKKLEDANLKARLHEAMVERVMAHFGGTLGDQGKGNASEG